MTFYQAQNSNCSHTVLLALFVTVKIQIQTSAAAILPGVGLGQTVPSSRKRSQGRIQPVGLTVFQNLNIQKWHVTTAS